MMIFFCLFTDQIGKAPCKTDSCIDSATCVNVASSPTCMCDAGYVEDGTCDVPICKCVKISIQFVEVTCARFCLLQCN